MLLSINFSCDFCGSSKRLVCYHPVNSLRKMHVVLCEQCGSVQSYGASKTPVEKRPTISCDADWGNIRHGKAARFGFIASVLDHYMDWSVVAHVLDVGSNRGDFVRWIKKKLPGVFITGIEPDPNIVADYRDTPDLTLKVDRFENVEVQKESFDFVFCSHTLEHASSASFMLKRMWNALKEGGVCFLEVPNIENLADPNGVEEFFIDKHVFHFDRGTLCQFLDSIGFEILFGRNSEDLHNISLLLKKETHRLRGPFPGNTSSNTVSRNLFLIERYADILKTNRNLLSRMVSEKLAPLAKRQKVAYWGAGRILDALFKYGGLKPDDVFTLVDKYLWKICEQVDGIPIQHPDRLRILEPNIVVVLARSSEELIARTAYRMGVRHVLRFSELLDQCRIPRVAVPNDRV